MLTLVLATRNAGKLKEFQALLPGLNLLPWPPEAPELPETGAFFQDNARQKAEGARAWWQGHRHQAVDGFLSDDSGLCVDALWGGPGVLTARFAPGKAQGDKNRLLLSQVPAGAPRSARFVCVLAHLPWEGEGFCVSGSVEGHLAPTPTGDQGFGYDPIFMPEGFDQTFGQLPPTTKHALSHRGRACAALREALGLV